MFNDKKILVTGASGTVGEELIVQLLQRFAPEEIIGIDNNESALFFMGEKYREDARLHLYLCDLANYSELLNLMDGVDYVFHLAALKHVVMCERMPSQAVETNILGVQNIINAATAKGVKKVVFTSSDKAVNPTNVMGTSKLMGERLMTAANAKSQNSTIFASTRFGNVLGSNGSVVPIFLKQIAAGGPLTLTDVAMTRFVMTLEQSVSLVIASCELARGGEVFITKMPVLRIIDLANAMIKKYAHLNKTQRAIDIINIGSKPGEKLYEELMSDEEMTRAIELRDYYVVKPAFHNLYESIKYDYEEVQSNNVSNPYISKNERCMTELEIENFLNLVVGA